MRTVIEERIEPPAPSRPIRVLIIEDNEHDAELEIRVLCRAGIHLEERVVSTEAAFRSALANFGPDIILSDFSVPGLDGIVALNIVRTECPEVPVIFVSGTLSEDHLVIAAEHGAADYVLKSHLIRLGGAVLRAIKGADEKRYRRDAEIRVARLSRVRDVFAAVNSAIVRLHEPGALFREACSIATEIGKFPFGAILTYGAKGNNLEVTAISGLDLRAALEEYMHIPRGRFERGVGSLATALRTKQAAVDNNLGADSSGRSRAGLWAAGLRSLGTFPLVVDGVAIGVLELGTQEPGFFDESEIELLTSMANNLSFALSLIKEQQRVTRLSRIRDVLSAVNEAIVRVDDRGALYREVCRIACETGGYINVFVVTYDLQGNRAHVTTVVGDWVDHLSDLEKSIATNFERGQGIVAGALRTARPAIINDLLESDLGFHESLREAGVRALGAFPLNVDDRVVGALVVETAETGYFDEDEIVLLTGLTNNISYALTHIDRRIRVARLSRIRDVLAAVNAAIVRLHDPIELYQETCRIAVEAGGFSNVKIVEVDLELRRIDIRAFVGSSDRAAIEAGLQRGMLDPEWTTGLIATSIRSLQPSIKNDIVRSPRRPVHERLIIDGIRSAGSFPIVVDGRATSAMVFQTQIPGYFDAEEIELLANLTNSLAFGLNVLEKQQRLDYLSYYDALTQLPNRTLFYDRLGQDIAATKKAGKTLVLAVVDISRFSVLNNTLGEHVGDEVLRKIASRLRETLEESQIARVGGDKFALCFPLIDDMHVVTDVITEDGIKIFETPFRIEDRELHIKARAGCVVFPSDGSDPQELFQNAEAALLSAKKSGTTFRFYAPEFNARLAKQLDLEARLERAVEEHQFVMFYQPKVDVVDRKIIGFEALIRWADPGRGIVAPSEFLPLLEKTGIIIPVGRWGLNEAARQYEEWRVAGLRPHRIAVNLSAVQLSQDRVIDDVRSAVDLFADECGLDLEITESMLMENLDHAIAKLNEIRSLGPEVALDDFGTGYSSLSYIHRLPLNTLKIDRSFIVGMTEDPNKMSIVSTIISLGQALKLKIVAEGVELEEEAGLLQLLRCDQIQGYLISKPLPADAAGNLLAKVCAVTSAGSGSP